MELVGAQVPALSTPENEAGGTPPVDRLPIWKLQRICLGCARGEFDSERRRWGKRSAPARRLPAWDRRHPTSPVHSLAVAVPDRIDAEAPVQGGGPSYPPRFPPPFLPQKGEDHLVGLAFHARREQPGKRRIVSGDRTTPWTGTVHHLSRGQRQ